MGIKMRQLVTVIILWSLGLINVVWAQSTAALTVEVIQPTIQQIMNSREVSGFINPQQIATVNARLNGVTLEEIYVDVGDYVQQGDLLVRFDDTLIRHELSQAKAQLQQSKVAYNNSRDNAQRAQVLLKEDAMSRLEGERYLSAKQDAQAQMDFAQAQVDMQNLRLSYTNVRSPVSGVVSDKSAFIGQTSSVGQPLITLIVDGKLEWQAEVPSDVLSQIDKGMPVTVYLPDDTEVQGKVYKISPTVDMKTRQGKVYVMLAQHPDVRAGLFVRGNFKFGEHQAMTIPNSAITREDGYNYVWLVGNSNQVRRQPITVIARHGDQVAVEGLAADVRLVARGGGFLVDGDLVKVVEMNANSDTAIDVTNQLE